MVSVARKRKNVCNQSTNTTRRQAPVPVSIRASVLVFRSKNKRRQKVASLVGLCAAILAILLYCYYQITMIESSMKKGLKKLLVEQQEPQSQGSFYFPPSASSTSSTSMTNNKTILGDLKVLVFMTTHMSSQHEMYLRSCWPRALKNSKLLQSSDIAVYLNPPFQQRQTSMQLLKNTFAHQNLTIHLYNNTRNDAEPLSAATANTGTETKSKTNAFSSWFQTKSMIQKQNKAMSIIKQSGAMDALQQASKHNWFQNYDWIIRLNPDVIIRNDTWMLDTILHDPSASGLFINCFQEYPTRGYKLHTDFFAVKTQDLPRGAFQHPQGRNAEMAFTMDVQETILDQKKHRWVPGAGPKRDICRAGLERDIATTDVTHFHHDWNFDYKCPIPFAG